MTSSSGIVSINGAKLWVEEAGAGPAVVLVHAGIADSRMWDDQWEALAASYRAIRYDLRGYGRSDIPPTPYAHHDDLRAVLDHLGVASAVLVAVSMGCEVALAFALGHPGRVRGLVLGGTLTGTDTRSDTLRAGWKAMEAAFEAGDLEQAVEIEVRMWVDGPYRTPDTVDPVVRERVREMDLVLLQRAEEQDLATELDPEMAVGENLDRVGCPVLLLNGGLDMPDTLASAEALQARLPDVRSAVFPNAAHLPNMEDPDRFTRLVLDFAGDLPGS